MPPINKSGGGGHLPPCPPSYAYDMDFLVEDFAYCTLQVGCHWAINYRQIGK